jgi:GNAT superfamily N-acetyltransferase
MVRLERGGPEFLTAVTNRLSELGADTVYSPALYPGSSRVWRRAGFEDHADLEIMERPLGTGSVGFEADTVRVERKPDWDQILEVDRLAFEGFWGMSRLALEEAHLTNRSRILLVAGAGSTVDGFAIIGSQWGTVYLHRIAVRPDAAGRGMGSALVAAAIEWGNRTGSKTMILNVRPENERAKELYRRHGFASTGSVLEVLRHGSQG